jgi:hypothetical protein
MPTTWYIARDGKQHGPVTDVEFRKLVELGHLKATDYVWHEGAPDWLPAAQVLERPPAAAGPEPQPRQPRPVPAERAGSKGREPVASSVALRSQRRIVIAAVAVVAVTVIGALSMLASDRFLGSSFFGSHVDRATVAQQLRVNAPHLDDDAMIRYVTLIGDQMEAFAQRNPGLCVRLLHGQPDIGDVGAYLPETLQAQEMQLLEEALLADKTESRRRYTKAEQTQIMQSILTKLARQHGDLVNLINPETPAGGRERDACRIGTALFREIAALPGTNSAALMRSLLSTQR